MIHFKFGYDKSQFERMTTQELREELRSLRSGQGSKPREEMLKQFQEDYKSNPLLTYVTDQNFDQYYIDDTDVVIDELYARQLAAQRTARGAA
jgi:hypothetical protein